MRCGGVVSNNNNTERICCDAFVRIGILKEVIFGFFMCIYIYTAAMPEANPICVLCVYIVYSHTTNIKLCGVVRWTYMDLKTFFSHIAFFCHSHIKGILNINFLYIRTHIYPLKCAALAVTFRFYFWAI